MRNLSFWEILPLWVIFLLVSFKFSTEKIHNDDSNSPAPGFMPAQNFAGTNLSLFASDNKFPRLSVLRGEPILLLNKEPISNADIRSDFVQAVQREPSPPGAQFNLRSIVAHRGTQRHRNASRPHFPIPVSCDILCVVFSPPQHKNRLKISKNRSGVHFGVQFLFANS